HHRDHEAHEPGDGGHHRRDRGVPHRGRHLGRVRPTARRARTDGTMTDLPLPDGAAPEGAAPDSASGQPVVLVANRGEIAARIVAAAHRIGARAVVAASAADTDSLAARAADRVVVIGPAPAASSYLRPELIAQAAVMVGADVVHPGYGFLSEQP